MCERACKRTSIKVCGCIDTRVYLHNVCMWHTHLRVSAHLCHTQLCSTCCGCATLPFTPPPFYQGHLTVQSQRSQAPSQQNRQHSRAHPRCRLSSIRRYKRHEIQYVITKPNSLQNQTKRQLQKASVSAEPSLALWLSP